MLLRTFLYGWARCFSLTGLYKFGRFFGLCEYLINYKRRARFNRKLGEIFGDTLTEMEDTMPGGTRCASSCEPGATSCST